MYNPIAEGRTLYKSRRLSGPRPKVDQEGCYKAFLVLQNEKADSFPQIWEAKLSHRKALHS